MNSELKRKDFIIAVSLGYLLVFGVLSPLLASMYQSDGLKAGLMFGLFSLLFGAPVALIAFIFGYPVFRSLCLKLRFGYFANVMLACLASALVTAMFCTLALAIIFGIEDPNVSGIASFIGAPTLLVAFFSGLLFWQRTR